MRSMVSAAVLAAALMVGGGAAAQVTGVTGGSQPIDNHQPSLVMTESVQAFGVFPTPDGGGGTSVIGQIHTFAGTFAPYGGPAAKGQLMSIAENDTLFQLIGTTYGGDGQTTFALPNLVGTAAMGAGQGPGLTNRTLGEEVGTASNVMTLAQLPDHDHGLPGGGVTGVTGSGNPAPLNNMQPSLALTYGIDIQGPFPSQSGGGNTEPFLGEVSLFSAGFAPRGFVTAAGQLLPINQNQALFAILGTTFGGDGRTTFGLPDLRGRVVVGAGQGPGLSNVTLGEKFGVESDVLNEANLPLHVHTLPGGGFTDPEGSDTPFQNEQPSLGLNYLIALQGVFPSRDDGNWDVNEPTLGEVIAFAGNFAPSGFAFAQGQLLSISQNTALFAILGTTYGGDGKTTFALPDLRGRTILGSGDGFNVGDLLGEESTTLTIDQMAAHDHTLPAAPGVPEPGVWTLMLAGFGGLGASLRRRRARVVAAA